jgi:hypothetical protein
MIGMICPQDSHFGMKPLAVHGFLDLFGLTTTTRKPPISPGNTLQISHVRSCDGAMVRNYGMKYELMAVSVYYPLLTSPSVQSLIFAGET